MRHCSTSSACSSACYIDPVSSTVHRDETCSGSGVPRSHVLSDALHSQELPDATTLDYSSSTHISPWYLLSAKTRHTPALPPQVWLWWCSPRFSRRLAVLDWHYCASFFSANRSITNQTAQTVLVTSRILTNSPPPRGAEDASQGQGQEGDAGGPACGNRLYTKVFY